MDEDSYWRLKVFTDNILLGYPLHSNELLHAEPEVFLAATHIAHYQLEMAREGFFIRGGISMGPLFIDDYIAYGPALNDAYEMEHKIARDPRVVVGPTMRQLLLEQLGRHSPAERALQNRDFLVDPDGQIFIHYLSGCLGESQEGSQDVDRETLGLHKQHIEKSLLEFVANPTVWAKYSWLACYHDYTVREWVEQGWLDSDLYIDSKLRRPTPVKLYSLLTTEVAPQE